jgi:hypothetical protein
MTSIAKRICAALALANTHRDTVFEVVSTDDPRIAPERGK